MADVKDQTQDEQRVKVLEKSKESRIGSLRPHPKMESPIRLEWHSRSKF